VPVAHQERVVRGGLDPFVEYEMTEHWQALGNELLSQPTECNESGGIGCHALELFEGGRRRSGPTRRRATRARAERQRTVRVYPWRRWEFHFSDRSNVKGMKGVGSLGMRKSLDLIRIQTSPCA
jgi:hypothetical protein